MLVGAAPEDLSEVAVGGAPPCTTGAANELLAALPERMTAVLGDELPELHSFVTGLRRDQDAVTTGLTLPYSSGPVEGHVNRIKMIKRQMYGRANPDLLRKRILLAD